MSIFIQKFSNATCYRNSHAYTNYINSFSTRCNYSNKKKNEAFKFTKSISSHGKSRCRWTNDVVEYFLLLGPINGTQRWSCLLDGVNQWNITFIAHVTNHSNVKRVTFHKQLVLLSYDLNFKYSWSLMNSVFIHFKLEIKIGINLKWQVEFEEL